MLTLIELSSSVALLVWGTYIVRTGIMRVFGSDLRRILGKSIGKKSRAFLAGIGVTALVQSSNATALLVISFVAQGLISMTPAMVIMLGADVGTAIMARVLTFDLVWLSPLLILFGVITFLKSEKKSFWSIRASCYWPRTDFISFKAYCWFSNTNYSCIRYPINFYLFKR
ncbi:MAG: Na/Pi symporter [Candidatus Arsenophonus phytopathogenicus]